MTDWLPDQPQCRTTTPRRRTNSLGSRGAREELADAPVSYRTQATRVPFSAFLHAKAQRAKKRGHIRVFLSHKQKDYSAAKTIHEILELVSAEKIKVFLSENIEKGDDWQIKNRR